MAGRPFQGAREPPPVAFLDDYLPEPRSAFDRAAEPILRSVLQMDDVVPYRAIQQPVPVSTVVSASMSSAGVSQEIYPLRILDVDPSTATYASPSRAYVEDVDLDLRFGWALNAPDAVPVGQQQFYHPLDYKMGIRVAILEFDTSMDSVYRANPAAHATLSYPPTLRDLLVEPNGYMEPPGETLHLNGPTDSTQYYSPWRRSLDQAERENQATYANTPRPATGAATTEALSLMRGNYAATRAVETNVQLRCEAPSPYTYRVLFDKQYEFNVQYADAQTAGAVVPAAVDGDQASYAIASEPTWRIPHYHGRVREKIVLKRTYLFRQAADTQFGTAFPLVNICPRRLYLVLIPKGSCKWTRDSAVSSVYQFYTPRVFKALVEMRGAFQLNTDSNDMMGITENDAVIKDSEVQQPQHGRPRYDMGRRKNKLSRHDEEH